jgi:hypothetical protein
LNGVPTRDDGVAYNGQIMLQQGQISRGAGNVRGAVDRDADIGGMKRRSIVDAVAEEADDMAQAL